MSNFLQENDKDYFFQQHLRTMSLYDLRLLKAAGKRAIVDAEIKRRLDQNISMELYRAKGLLPDPRYWDLDLIEEKFLTFGWSTFTENQNITLEFLNRHRELFPYMITNKAVTKEFFYENIGLFGNPRDAIFAFCGNPNVDDDFISLNVQEGNTLDWILLSKRASLQFIDNHPDLRWQWHVLPTRNDLTIEFVDKYMKKFAPNNTIYSNKVISLARLNEKYETLTGRDKTAFLSAAAKNPNITISFVKEKMDPIKHYNFLMSNEGISVNDIINELSLDMTDINRIYGRLDVTEDMILNPEWPFRGIHGIYQNRNLSLQFILDNWDNLTDIDKIYLANNGFTQNSRYVELAMNILNM